MSGAVADGVKAELEAGSGAFDGHRVELGLVVARDAGVAGIVGVGRVEGGGARAERAVHEALEHAGVEQGIAAWVGGRRCFEGRRRACRRRATRLMRRWSLPDFSRASRTRKSSQSEKSCTLVTPWARASLMAR